MKTTARHFFWQSAVLERCRCGELASDPIHIPLDPSQPVRNIVQVSISPDNDKARIMVQETLHWVFLHRIDVRSNTGIWNVATIRPWPLHADFACTFCVPDAHSSGGVMEIKVTLGWP